MKNVKNLISIPYATVFVAVCAIVVACSQPTTESPKTATAANAQSSIPPLGNPQGSASPSASVVPSGQPTQACWDQILKSPAALACKTLFAYSTQTCVSGLTKQATCTADDINKAYGSQLINGQLVSAQVKSWIDSGFSDMQCAIGSDTKLYVYFLKKTYTPASASSPNATYKFEEQTLGPPGAILNSIKLNPAGTAASVANCTSP